MDTLQMRLATAGDAPVPARPGMAATAARTPLLELSGISKRFGGVQALNDMRLAAHAGEVVALVGENGAGKSTLVKILTGIHRPDAGEIRLAGERLELASA